MGKVSGRVFDLPPIAAMAPKSNERKGNVEGWPRRGSRGCVRAQKVSSIEIDRCSCRSRCNRIEKEFCLHSARSLPCKDSRETCNQSRQAGNVRESDDSEGKAGKDCRESIRRR